MRKISSSIRRIMRMKGRSADMTAVARTLVRKWVNERQRGTSKSETYRT